MSRLSLFCLLWTMVFAAIASSLVVVVVFALWFVMWKEARR